MKVLTHPWFKRIALGAAIAVPLVTLAHGPAAETCPPPGAGEMRRLPPEPAPPGASPAYLRGVVLSEEQQDRIFALSHARQPAEREQMKTARKALDELQRLASGDAFDMEKARALSEIHAEAMAKLVLMQAEFDSKVRALLTPEQRKAADAARGDGTQRRLTRS